MSLATIDQPNVVAEELDWIIRQKMAEHPRSQQTVIGPSELGQPCARALLFKLCERPPPVNGFPDDKWLANIGTAVHTWLDNAITTVNNGQMSDRFLTEFEVAVGTVGGHTVRGHLDAFDTQTGTVIDWKIVGTSRLSQYRASGPGQQYRSQIHLYGRGLARAGYTVNNCMIYFLPRDAKLSSAYPWHEPYDERVALEALYRAEGMMQLVAVYGFDAVLAMTHGCGQRFCRYCPTSLRS